MQVIVPPRDDKLRARLIKKLAEYKARIKEPGSPWENMQPESAHKLYFELRDAYYKAYILEAVLNSDQPVDTYELSKTLAKIFGEGFDLKRFIIACGVISFYCGDNTNKAIGGTGLPDV